MGGFPEYGQYDGLGLAELVRQGQVTPDELCQEAIERIERLNPQLNAVVTSMFDQARQAAAGPPPDGPFSGVPFLLKDLLCDYAGVPTSYGCKALLDQPAQHDSEMVTRFKRAGLVILGKTNTPEFGLLGVTEPEAFGPCRNPWDPEYTPGGSSGGSAAAVAAGMAPMASGGDGGGSLRIPASYCGLFGLKPSRGRNPSGPNHGRVWQGAVQEHAITRSVRDSAALLDATQGPDPGAPYQILPPKQPFRQEVETEPGQLRIAFSGQSPLGTPVHEECLEALEETASLLEELGHQVQPDQPAIDGLALAQGYLAMYFGEVAADIQELETVLGRKARPRDVESLTWMLGLLGRTYSAGYFVEAMRRWDQAAREMGRFFQRYDLYLTPTTAQPPARIGQLDPKPAEALLVKTVNALGLGWLLKASGLVDQMAQRSLARTPFTQLANLCGLPAMSLPLYWTAQGLPCGSQFIGPLGGEALMFRLAGQLERARPWFQRRPGLAA